MRAINKTIYYGFLCVIWVFIQLEKVYEQLSIFRLSLITLLAGWTFWPYLWHGAFYQGLGVALTGFAWCFYRQVKVSKTDSLIFLLLCLSNLADELFFDPTAIELNEYIMAGLMVATISTIQYRKHARPRRKQDNN